MKKNDIVTIVIFSFLVISILVLVGINAYENKPLEVDRKVKKIHGQSYASVLSKAEVLFTTTLDLLMKEDSVLEYEKTREGTIALFSVNEHKNLKKIKNISVVTNNFTENGLKEYFLYKKIITNENKYYIENNKSIKNNYIGSELIFFENDNVNIYFDVVNYYCDNHEYIGLIKDSKDISCTYVTTNSKYYITYDNLSYRIDSINNFLTIMNNN